MKRNAWRVVISEQDGSGGGRSKNVWFDDYDDAHAFYAYIKSQYRTPFYTSIHEPPTLQEFDLPYARGEWKAPQKGGEV